MSGAEEAPPTSNPTPAVVPSPDESAREVTEQDIDVLGVDNDSGAGAEGNGSVDGEKERLGSVTIDPSYNPNGEEELLYEGDVDVEPPLPKEKEGASQDEGFMINVHETGMELDMAESLSESHSKVAASGENGSGKSSSPLWRSAEKGGAKKATPSSSKSVQDSKISSSKDRDIDRFVHCMPSPSSHRSPSVGSQVLQAKSSSSHLRIPNQA